jgi:hypothetical protein
MVCVDWVGERALRLYGEPGKSAEKKNAKFDSQETDGGASHVFIVEAYSRVD